MGGETGPVACCLSGHGRSDRRRAVRCCCIWPETSAAVLPRRSASSAWRTGERVLSFPRLGIAGNTDSLERWFGPCSACRPGRATRPTRSWGAMRGIPPTCRVQGCPSAMLGSLTCLVMAAPHLKDEGLPGSDPAGAFVAVPMANFDTSDDMQRPLQRTPAENTASARRGAPCPPFSTVRCGGRRLAVTGHGFQHPRSEDRSLVEVFQVWGTPRLSHRQSCKISPRARNPGF